MPSTRVIIRPIPWMWLFLAVAAIALPPIYLAIRGLPWNQPQPSLIVAVLALVMAAMAWRGQHLEVTETHVRHHQRGREVQELPRDQLAGVERHGALTRLHTHDGAELWLTRDWSRRDARRMARALGLPEPVTVRATEGGNSVVIRDWVGIGVAAGVITLGFAAVGAGMAAWRGVTQDFVITMAVLNAVIVLLLVGAEYFGAIRVAQDAVQGGPNRVLVRRDTVREVMSVRDQAFLRDDDDRWFALGKLGPSGPARLAAALEVPHSKTDRVAGRIIG